MQISNLPASNSFSSTDVLPIEINGVTYKVAGATLAAALQTLGNYLTTDNVANNLTTIAAGSVLDARQGKVLADKLDATQSDIAIIIDGNQTTHTGGAAIGEFVLVRNSTISGISDGLYTAAQAIPANTAIDSTYLTAVDGGGLNAVNTRMNITKKELTVISSSGIKELSSFYAYISGAFAVITGSAKASTTINTGNSATVTLSGLTIYDSDSNFGSAYNGSMLYACSAAKGTNDTFILNARVLIANTTENSSVYFRCIVTLA